MKTTTNALRRRTERLARAREVAERFARVQPLDDPLRARNDYLTRWSPSHDALDHVRLAKRFLLHARTLRETVAVLPAASPVRRMFLHDQWNFLNACMQHRYEAKMLWRVRHSPKRRRSA